MLTCQRKHTHILIHTPTNNALQTKPHTQSVPRPRRRPEPHGTGFTMYMYATLTSSTRWEHIAALAYSIARASPVACRSIATLRPCLCASVAVLLPRTNTRSANRLAVCHAAELVSAVEVSHQHFALTADAWHHRRVEVRPGSFIIAPGTACPYVHRDVLKLALAYFRTTVRGPVQVLKR